MDLEAQNLMIKFEMVFDMGVKLGFRSKAKNKDYEG
jgi:hypothetical protein